MIFLLLASIFLFTITNGDAISWDHLSAKFMKFSKLPMQENEAIESRWKLLADNCQNKSPHGFLGKRYMLRDEHATILIYDVNGQIAGFQMSYKTSLKNGHYGKYASMRVIDGDYYYLTAYFTDPANVCNQDLRRPEGYVGDQLVFMTGKGKYMTVPKHETALKGTEWKLGKCFTGMGTHYWYDISNNMPCDDMFPAFILYNKSGELVAWGFVSDVDIPGSRVEHPPGWLIGWFFRKKTEPKCLRKLAHRSTQHVYLTKVGWFTHTCWLG